MQKVSPKYQALLILISLAVVAGLFSAGSKKLSEQPAVPVTETPDTNQSVSWPSEELSQAKIDRSDAKRKITAVYPVTKSESVNAYFKQFVDEQIKQFSDDTSWIDESMDGETAGGLSLDITYKNKRSVYADNYIFTITSYTGGAHGLSVTKTFSFSEQGELITPANLFSNGLNGLKTIAPYVEKEIAKRKITDAEWLREGTAPTEDNYRSIVITDTGIQVIFDPYHVAAYAAGMQTVDVPLSAFKSVANPNIFTR